MDSIQIIFISYSSIYININGKYEHDWEMKLNIYRIYTDSWSLQI